MSQRAEGFYKVRINSMPPEMAVWENGFWWFCGDDSGYPDSLVTVEGEMVLAHPTLTRRPPG